MKLDILVPRIIIGAFVLVGVFACSRPTSKPISVTSRRTVISDIYVNGRVQPQRRLEIRSQMDGRVERVFAKEGSQVSKGSLLMTFSANREEAERIRLIQNELANMKNERASLKAQRDEIAATIKRFKRLISSDGIALQDIESKTTRLKVLENEIRSIDSKSDTIVVNLREKIRAKDEGKIYSPLAGIVSYCFLPIEQIAEKTSVKQDDLLFAIDDVSGFVVKGTLKETDALKLRVGMSGRMHLSADSTTTWPGKISFISALPMLNKSSGVAEYKFEVVSPQFPRQTRIGAEIGGLFNLATRSDVLTVPRSSVGLIQGGWFVDALVSGGFVTHSIKIGLIGDQYVEILGGLREGDRVATVFEGNYE